MGTINWARLYINGSHADRVPIVLPEHSEPGEPVTAATMVRARVTLDADDIAEIGQNGTYYDLRIRLYEEDNSPWPWGDDTDDRIWQQRPRLLGQVSQWVEVVVPVFKTTLRDYGAEYYAGVRLYRRTDSSMTGLQSLRTNTINLDYV